MNRTLHIAGSCVVALVLVTGCRQYRTREFVEAQGPVKCENWRLYVNALVDAASPSPTNHFYRISALAWTLPGDAYWGDPNAFRPSAYDASLDSLRLFRVEATSSVELPLPPLHQGSTDHPNRLVQMAPTNGVRIETAPTVSNEHNVSIPASRSPMRASPGVTVFMKPFVDRLSREFKYQRTARLPERSSIGTERYPNPRQF